MTVLDLISGSMRLVGILASGEVPNATEAQDALTVLNELVQEWNTQELMIYTLTRNAYPIVAGQQMYTLSAIAGSDWLEPRPTYIQQASVILNTNPSLPIELPIRILDDNEWQDTVVKATTSTFPTCMWISGNYPVQQIYLWPVPMDSTNEIMLGSWGKSEAFTALTDTVSFPNGYAKALRYNLAVELAAEYGKPLDPTIQRIAMASKASVESFNAEPSFSRVDSPGRASSGWSLAVQSRGRLVDR